MNKIETKSMNRRKKGGAAMSTDTTPTPWHVVPDTLGSIEGPDGTSVAQCQQTRPVKTAQDHAERLSNAALIVQAVNERESLLAERDALKSALERIMEYANDGARIRDIDPNEQPQFIAARNALKGGKQSVR